MSDLALPDALAERIRGLAQSEKLSVEELLTVMVDRYTVASRLKVAEKPITLSGAEGAAEEEPDYPIFGAYPPGSLKAIIPDNIDEMTILGALNFPGRVCGVGYSPDGKYLAIRLETSMILWDISAAQEYAVFEHNAWIETFTFTPDGKSLIVSAGNMLDKNATGSTLHYWNVATRQDEYTWTPQVGFANTLAVNPQNPAIIALLSLEREIMKDRPNAITTSNVGVELWDGQNLITRYTDFRAFYREGYNKLNDRVLAFGRDGKTIYVCLDNGGHFSGQVLAWEGLGSGELKAVSEPDECGMGFTLDRQGKNLAICNAREGKLSVRNLESGAVIYTNEDAHQRPSGVRFDATGSILIVRRSFNSREAVRIDFINLQTGETIKQWASPHGSGVNFSPDFTLIADTGNQKVVLWGLPQ